MKRITLKVDLSEARELLERGPRACVAFAGRTVGFQSTLQELDGKCRHGEGITENWQALVAWNGLKTGVFRHRGEVAPDGLSAQLPASDYRSTLEGKPFHPVHDAAAFAEASAPTMIRASIIRSGNTRRARAPPHESTPTRYRVFGRRAANAAATASA